MRNTDSQEGSSNNELTVKSLKWARVASAARAHVFVRHTCVSFYTLQFTKIKHDQHEQTNSIDLLKFKIDVKIREVLHIMIMMPFLGNNFISLH